MPKLFLSSSIRDDKLKEFVQWFEQEQGVLFISSLYDYRFAGDTRANLYLTPEQMIHFFDWFKKSDVTGGFPEIHPTLLYGEPFFNVVFSRFHFKPKL